MARYTRPSNTHLLDQAWQGDEIFSHKDSHTTRLMFHNVNGLSVRGTDGIDMFAHDQETLQVDIQGFSEHCLDTTKYQVYQTAQDVLRQKFQGQSALLLHSSAESALNLYKPGGTGILALGDVVSRLEPQGKGGDHMGRWSYLHLRREALPPVTIISAYQVCPRPTNLLGNTAYHQQLRALGAAGTPNLHPRRAFIRDLSTFVSTLTSQGHDIVLGGDFNESLEDNNSGILQLVTANNLVDPFMCRFPTVPVFGTHVMGQRRIDSVFLTRRLMASVRKIGYAPFQYATPSDHRPVLLDLDSRILFGHRHDPLPPASTRGLKSKDKKSVTCFINKWYDAVVQRDGFSLKQLLDTDQASPSTVEEIDDILGKAGDIAEQACRRRRPEFYSSQIVQQRMRVSILRGHLQSLRLGIDRSGPITKRMNRAGIDFPLPTTIRATMLSLRLAHQDLQDTIKEHSEVRKAELKEKIDEAARKGKKTRAKILRAIKKTEDNQRTYNILRAMKRRGNESQRIDRIEIPSSWPSPSQPITSLDQLEDPKTCSDWRLVTDPDEVEHYLMIRNRLHFGQAEGTPFTRPPLIDELDWAATTPVAETLLQGQYTQRSIVPDCDDLLQACTSKAKLDQLPAELTRAEFRGKIKTWRETTTTSPSGRHLGRYKALFAAGALEEDGDECSVATSSSDRQNSLLQEVSFRDKQEWLASFVLSVINYCIRNNYVLDRWKTIVNVMIFKEQGNYKIHRLRIIHIYEADFNLLLAVKWRQLLRTADDAQLINEGQYGGRPGCEAQSLTFLEELKYDLAYLTRRTLFNFDNDATSCYDRIVVPLASLINRKYGLHRKVVAVHARTLQQARFHLKTATGISSSHYSPCTRFPIHGTGQGSGNSPSIWLFISSTLFDIHHAKSHGASFVSPDGQHSVSFSMVGFVDDSTGTCNDFQQQQEAPLEELLKRMEYDAQLWNNLLYCSGGKLELPKCSFHVLRFQFKPCGQPVPSLDTFDNQIQVTDIETQIRISIPSKRPFDPHKTLGHYKSPTSRQNTELDILQGKAQKLALLISVSPVTRQGALLAYYTVYIPTIQYTLPQSFFGRKRLEHAQASSLHKIIAKCGYNRNTARALIFAPSAYAGGGFLPWHLLQGEGQIKLFLKHWRTDSIVSRTLRIAVMWAQWQSGHALPILEDPDTPLPHLECRWLTSLREFLHDIKGKLSVDTPLVSPNERKHDVHIMTFAIQSGYFTDQDLRIINYCRLYLHVVTMSELFEADGRTVIPELFRCQREPWFDSSVYVTLQNRPSEYQIKMRWQKLCRQWTQASGQLAASMNLGGWTTPGQHLRRRRKTYIIPNIPHKLFHWTQECYWEYFCQDPGSKVFRPKRATQWLPKHHCIPAQVSEQPDGSLHLSFFPRGPLTPSETVQPITSFRHYVAQLPSWEQKIHIPSFISYL